MLDRLGALTLVALGCGPRPDARAPVTAASCAPPIAPDTSELRATFHDGGDCVALVDVELGPASARPAIWRRIAVGGWREVALPGAPDTRVNHGWAAAAGHGRTIVAALDSRIEAPGWELAILRSADGGATWQGPVVVTKPYYLATVQSLELFGADRATLVIALDDDYGAGVTPGRYQFTSVDGGATWSPARLAVSR